MSPASDTTFPSHFTPNSSYLASPSEIPEPPSYCSIQSGSDLDATRYTCLSSGQVYTHPVSSESSLNPAAVATPPVEPVSPTATMTGVPSIPSYSTAGPSTSLEPSSEPSDPSGSGSTDPPTTTASHATWPDMGPHVAGDVVDPIFEELYNFQNLVQLRHAQWFLSHFLVRHESLSHQLLIVSFALFSYFHHIL